MTVNILISYCFRYEAQSYLTSLVKQFGKLFFTKSPAEYLQVVHKCLPNTESFKTVQNTCQSSTCPEIQSLFPHLDFTTFQIMLLSLHLPRCIIIYSFTCLFLKEITGQGRHEDLILHVLVSSIASTETHSFEISEFGLQCPIRPQILPLLWVIHLIFLLFSFLTSSLMTFSFITTQLLAPMVTPWTLYPVRTISLWK